MVVFVVSVGGIGVVVTADRAHNGCGRKWGSGRMIGGGERS